MKPHQIISLMTFDGADNTFAMGDHADHIHVGWRPLYGENKEAAKQIDAILKPKQWIKLIDRRVLATLEFLAASGFKPTVTSLRCGHSLMTASGNVSEHSSGNAVDIAAVNGIPIQGHQGAGSIAEATVDRLLTLQGTMKPHQIISLMKVEGTDNTFAMGDHADHIHVGWQPLYGSNSAMAKQVDAALKPKQWIKLIDRLGRIDNPPVRTQPSRAALEVERRAGTRGGG